MAKSDVELRLERLEAAHEVENLVGRYEFLHVANRHRQSLELFALDTPGVKVQMDWGVFEGRSGVERFFLGYHGGHNLDDHPDADVRGDLHLHPQTTPVIEVAADGQSARGVWISPGVETIPSFADRTKMAAYWCWLKYAFDFVKEEGVWKILHMNTYNIFMTPYEKSWVEAGPMPPRREMPADRAPDRYLENPAPWTYGVDKPHLNIPVPPAPYDTLGDENSY